MLKYIHNLKLGISFWKECKIGLTRDDPMARSYISIPASTTAKLAHVIAPPNAIKSFRNYNINNVHESSLSLSLLGDSD